VLKKIKSRSQSVSQLLGALPCRQDRLPTPFGVRIGNDCVVLNRVGNFGSEPWLIELGDHVQLLPAVILLTHTERVGCSAADFRT